MKDDRRYRQQGYQDSGGDKGPKGERPGPPGPAPGPVLGQRAVSRCAECGTPLGPGTDPRGSCPQCGAAVHACKQCSHFDPGRRFECDQAIPQRLPDKRATNDCPEFSLRVAVERDASPGSVRPADARRAFDDLFRKPPG
jgi:predicted RNA-binding Zn-ribbon protein involved in translation (DUF1610 family)